MTDTYTKQLSRHTGTGWSGGGGGSSTRGRTDSDGAEQRPPGRPLLCLPERAVCLRPARARSGAGKHGGAGKRGGGDGGGGSGTRGRTGSDGAEQRPPGRPLLRLPRARRSAQFERGQAQGSVAARGRAAAVASRRAARARRGGQVIGRRVMGWRVTAPSDRSEPIVARPQLTSKACGARLSVSEGGRHVARREDDKCASYGSLFIGQSRRSSRDRSKA